MSLLGSWVVNFRIGRRGLRTIPHASGSRNLRRSFRDRTCFQEGYQFFPHLLPVVMEGASRVGTAHPVSENARVHIGVGLQHLEHFPKCDFLGRSAQFIASVNPFDGPQKPMATQLAENFSEVSGRNVLVGSNFLKPEQARFRLARDVCQRPDSVAGGLRKDHLLSKK